MMMRGDRMMVVSLLIVWCCVAEIDCAYWS